MRENIDLWISSENISMRFILEDIDYYEKFLESKKYFQRKQHL